MGDPTLFNPQTVALWAKAAQGLILHWRRTGPTPAGAQWCSDAVRIMEMAAVILEAAASTAEPAVRAAAMEHDKSLCADCTTEHACRSRLDVPRPCAATPLPTHPQQEKPE